MKFIISKNELSELIGHIQNVVAQKGSIPILSNFLIEAVGNEIVMTATDLTVGVRCRTEAKVIEEGATTLPAKRFFQLIRELTAPHIEFSCNANDVTQIIAGDSRFHINGMNKSEFPSLPNLSGATQFNIQGEQLKEALFRTAFAVSKEEHRHILTGVLMGIENGNISFVGTDGKRLAKMEQTVTIDPAFSGKFVLPIKAVDEMLKIPSSNNVTIYLMEDRIAIEADKITIITKLLSGEYPDVTRVIPQTAETTITLHREELMSLLRQISLFTPNNDHPVRFIFSDGNLKLSANDAEVGDAKVNMPVNYSGEPLQIAFNPGYFLDILRHSKDETVNIDLIDCYNPGIITDSSTALCVLMPMRLNEE
ncbi:MAG: DNA polymerase III subunit beta [Chlamydiota bacterium]